MKKTTVSKLNTIPFARTRPKSNPMENFIVTRAKKPTTVVRLLAKEIKDLSYVKNVTALADTLPEGIPEEFLPKSTVELLHKDGYCRMLIYTRTKTESAEAFKDSDAIQEIVKKYYPEGSYLVGETPSTQDIKSFIVKDYENVNVLSLAGVFLVVMMSFKSAVMPILVIIPIEVAIFINMAMPYFQGVEMVYMGYILSLIHI